MYKVKSVFYYQFLHTHLLALFIRISKVKVDESKFTHKLCMSHISTRIHDLPWMTILWVIDRNLTILIMDCDPALLNWLLVATLYQIKQKMFKPYLFKILRRENFGQRWHNLWCGHYIWHSLFRNIYINKNSENKSPPFPPAGQAHLSIQAVYVRRCYFWGLKVLACS